MNQPTMYDLTILSIFRDSTGYLDRYLDQVIQVLPHFDSTCLVWLEGDSIDGTYEALKRDGTALSEAYNVDVILTKYNTGQPYYPSTDNADRWRHLCDVWNRNLSELPETNYAVAVESDLIWDWHAMKACLDHLDKGAAEVVYPGLWHVRGHFYDTNSFRINGHKFTNQYPHAPGWNGSDRYLEVDSAGGMIVTTGKLMAQAEWRDSCILQFPTWARLVADMHTKVFHP